MTKADVLNYLKEHYQEFHNKYSVDKTGLFGSYVRDEATKDSDIDIFLIFLEMIKRDLIYV